MNLVESDRCAIDLFSTLTFMAATGMTGLIQQPSKQMHDDMIT